MGGCRLALSSPPWKLEVFNFQELFGEKPNQTDYSQHKLLNTSTKLVPVLRTNSLRSSFYCRDR